MSATRTCPTCGPREPDQLEAVPLGQAAVATLTDWRTWLLAFICMGTAGAVATLFQLNPGATVGGGAATGLLVGGKLLAVRRCKGCGKLIR